MKRSLARLGLALLIVMALALGFGSKIRPAFAASCSYKINIANIGPYTNGGSNKISVTGKIYEYANDPQGADLCGEYFANVTATASGTVNGNGAIYLYGASGSTCGAYQASAPTSKVVSPGGPLASTSGYTNTVVGFGEICAKLAYATPYGSGYTLSGFYGPYV